MLLYYKNVNFATSILQTTAALQFIAESLVKRGAKLQQACLIGASDDTGKRRGALAPVDVGGGFKPAA